MFNSERVPRGQFLYEMIRGYIHASCNPTVLEKKERDYICRYNWTKTCWEFRKVKPL